MSNGFLLGIVAVASVTLLAGGCGHSSHLAKQRSQLVSVQSFPWWPSQYKAVSGRTTFIVSNEQPYTLSVGLLGDKKRRRIPLGVACGTQPIIAAVSPPYIVMECTTPKAQGFVMNINSDHKETMWTWSGQTDGEESVAFAGTDLFWVASQGPTLGDVSQGMMDLTTGLTSPLPKDVANGQWFSDYRSRKMYTLDGDILSQWRDGKLQGRGTLPGTPPATDVTVIGGNAKAVVAQTLEAIVETPGHPYLETWAYHGTLVSIGADYSVALQPGGKFKIVFPSRHKTVTVRIPTSGTPIATPIGDVFVPTTTGTGVERIIIDTSGTNAIGPSQWPMAFPPAYKP